jgi:hypothetical protein
LILYELLAGKPAFSKTLTRYQIASRVFINDERPTSPQFVLLSAQKLIADCWETEPGKRISFEGIVKRLVRLKCEITQNAHSAKLSAFIKEIEEYERDNEKTSQ